MLEHHIPEPQHTRELRPFHQAYAHVMETLAMPLSATFRYEVGMYVYVHEHAYETNSLSAQECVIEDVTNAPLEITVRPCNGETAFTVCQDKLSAPIWV